MKFIRTFDNDSEYILYRGDKGYTKPNVSYSRDTEAVHYNYPATIIYDYVDLGLPSGTKWATTNVGAYKPSDTGLYFQWGDTSGYTADQVGKDKQFTMAYYKWSIDGGYSNFSKYTKEGATLELEDDAAHVHMGGDWYMPTPTQIQELINETTNTWTAQNGVNGRLFTSKIDASKSIFIPAVGLASSSSIYGSGSNGFVWSSTLSTYGVGNVQILFFSSGEVYLYGNNRYYGRSVRGVVDG